MKPLSFPHCHPVLKLSCQAQANPWSPASFVCNIYCCVRNLSKTVFTHINTLQRKKQKHIILSIHKKCWPALTRDFKSDPLRPDLLTVKHTLCGVWRNSYQHVNTTTLTAQDIPIMTNSTLHLLLKLFSTSGLFIQLGDHGSTVFQNIRGSGVILTLIFCWSFS